MTNLIIEGTQSTPAVFCDSAAGTVEMRGDSYPENSFELFSPIIDWIDRFFAAGDGRVLTLNLHLLYLNTSSVRAMMDIFDLLEEAHGRGRGVTVHWFYDEQNERVAELAEEFREDYTFRFDIVPQPE